MIQKFSLFVGLCLTLMFPVLAGSPETDLAADSSGKAVTPCDASLKTDLALARAIDRNGAVRYEYAGDAQGNLCRYDFPGKSAEANAKPNNGKLIFTAKDANGKPQPIMQQPQVAFMPGGYLVLFGTGRSGEEPDALPGNFSMQSFYGIYDAVNVQSGVLTRGNLDRRHLENNGNTLKVAGAPPGKFLKGWYLDFAASEATGERSVTSPFVADGVLVFHTMIPGADMFNAATGHTYILNVLTGLPVDGDATGFLPNTRIKGGPPELDLVDSEVIGKDALGRWTIRKKYAIRDSAGGEEEEKPARRWEVVGPAEQVGRLSWREISLCHKSCDAN